MPDVDGNQPLGTPTWIDLAVPDLQPALDFYGAVFGWEFRIGPEEYGSYTTCLLRGRPVAAVFVDAERTPAWDVYLATPDCDDTTARAREAGAAVLEEPTDVMAQGRMAMLRDPVGARVGLWQGRDHVGCQVVNEPGALVRNDLVTPDPGPARRFYAEVFGFTLDGNPDLPGFDFTFLRRPDGHEVGGVLGLPDAAGSAWGTALEVADADETVRRALGAGGRSPGVEAFVYGRMATVVDPFGAEFSVIARPAS
ncbi:VOC family protein [Geodermatophilus sp. CPCC 206100]|uniref:VOC family protein n=1 Tax=Geodermatophilus sp. CPCC 206100 TaxID=3020054 RepID=UPI003B00E390